MFPLTRWGSWCAGDFHHSPVVVKLKARSSPRSLWPQRSCAAPSSLITAVFFFLFLNSYEWFHIRSIHLQLASFHAILYIRDLSILINFTYLTYFNNNISFYGYLTLMFYYYNVQYLALLHVRFYLGYIPRRVWVVSQSLTLFELPMIFPKAVVSVYIPTSILCSHHHLTFIKFRSKYGKIRMAALCMCCVMFLYLSIHLKYSIIESKLSLWLPPFIGLLDKDLEFLLMASAHVTELSSTRP